MAALLNIGGIDMPTPSDYNVGIQDIKKAERNTNGNLIGELINTKVKIDLNWKYLTQVQLSQVLAAVAPNFFTVTYFNPVTGTTRTATFYSGDRTVGMIDFIGGVARYKDLKFNIIEK